MIKTSFLFCVLRLKISKGLSLKVAAFTPPTSLVVMWTFNSDFRESTSNADREFVLCFCSGIYDGKRRRDPSLLLEEEERIG